MFHLTFTDNLRIFLAKLKCRNFDNSCDDAMSIRSLSLLKN